MSEDFGKNSVTETMADDAVKQPPVDISTAHSFGHIPASKHSFSSLPPLPEMVRPMRSLQTTYMFPFDYGARPLLPFPDAQGSEHCYLTGFKPDGRGYPPPPPPFPGPFPYGLPFTPNDNQLTNFSQTPRGTVTQTVAEEEDQEPEMNCSTSRPLQPLIAPAPMQALPFTLFRPPPGQYFPGFVPPPTNIRSMQDISPGETEAVNEDLGHQDPVDQEGDPDSFSTCASPAPSAMLSPQTSKLLQSAIESEGESIMALSPGTEHFPSPCKDDTQDHFTVGGIETNTQDMSQYEVALRKIPTASVVSRGDLLQTNSAFTPESTKAQYRDDFDHFNLPSCQYANSATTPSLASVKSQPQEESDSEEVSHSDDDEDDDEETDSDETSSNDDDEDFDTSKESRSSDLDLNEDIPRVDSPFTRIRPSLLKSFRASKNYKDKKRLKKTRKLELMSPLSPFDEAIKDESPKITVKQDMKVQTSEVESEVAESSSTEDESEPQTPFTPSSIGVATPKSVEVPSAVEKETAIHGDICLGKDTDTTVKIDLPPPDTLLQPSSAVEVSSAVTFELQKKYIESGSAVKTLTESSAAALIHKDAGIRSNEMDSDLKQNEIVQKEKEVEHTTGNSEEVVRLDDSNIESIVYYDFKQHGLCQTNNMAALQTSPVSDVLVSETSEASYLINHSGRNFEHPSDSYKENLDNVVAENENILMDTGSGQVVTSAEFDPLKPCSRQQATCGVVSSVTETSETSIAVESFNSSKKLPAVSLLKSGLSKPLVTTISKAETPNLSSVQIKKAENVQSLPKDTVNVQVVSKNAKTEDVSKSPEPAQEKRMLLPIRTIGPGTYAIIIQPFVDKSQVTTDKSTSGNETQTQQLATEVPKKQVSKIRARKTVQKPVGKDKKNVVILPKPYQPLTKPCQLSQDKTSVMLDKPILDGPSISQGFYCVDCNKMYPAGCPHHEQNYSRIEDNDMMLTKARCSVPPQLALKLMYNQNSPDFIGVVSQAFIPSKTQFGPLQGLRTNKNDLENPENTAYVWEIFDESTPNLVLDCRNEAHSNWLMFVKRARSSVEQNMNVYQQGHDIYFITIKDIQPYTELLYWYAMDYARMLGVCTKPEENFRCPSCHREFPDMQTLRTHSKSAHPHLQKCTHSCKECGKLFTVASKLSLHEDIHKGVKKFECKVCGAKFNNASNLNRHAKLHSENHKRFECNICGKKFSQKTHLENHVVIHSESRDHQCRFCEASFKRRIDRMHHEKQVHLIGKEYACTENNCNKVFYKLDNLKKHLLIHRGERRFQCYQCDKKFQQKAHLKTHLAMVHKMGYDSNQPKTHVNSGGT